MESTHYREIRIEAPTSDIEEYHFYGKCALTTLKKSSKIEATVSSRLMTVIRTESLPAKFLLLRRYIKYNDNNV